MALCAISRCWRSAGFSCEYFGLLIRKGAYTLPAAEFRHEP
jgi:hypothetical protein